MRPPAAKRKVPVPTITEADVRSALTGVKDPARNQDVISLGMVQEIAIRDGNVAFALEAEPARAKALEVVRRACEQAVLSLPGVASVSAVLTAERQPQAPAGPGAGAHAISLPGVRSIIAVASGKGGVGKSTVTANLALAMRRQGLQVGILDADIYGPSQPRLMGISGRPHSIDGRRIRPMAGYGIKVMSIGFMVDEERPMIWRGPMVQGALEQLLRDVEWGELDVLLVDMPPGTGDVQLTMSQRVPLRGAVIVSTPQDIALIDARKGLNMFRRVDVPVLGFIENMSWFACPKCGARTEIFAHGGAEQAAAAMQVPFLGGIPLHLKIRETSDQGQPIVATAPESAEARAFVEVADRIAATLQEADTAAMPEISFD